MVTISNKEYQRHVRKETGFCTSCNELTTEGVDPYADGQVCDLCGDDTVIGLANAVGDGELMVEGHNDDMPDPDDEEDFDLDEDYEDELEGDDEAEMD